MYYVDFYSLFNHPEKDWEACLKEAAESPQMPSLFDEGGAWNAKKRTSTALFQRLRRSFLLFLTFIGQQ